MALEQPDIEPVSGGKYQLRKDFTYEWERKWPDGNTYKYRITVKSGFIYDGASVPRFLWTFAGITPDGLHRAAALVHDWMYEHEGKLPVDSQSVSMDGGHTWVHVPAAWSRSYADRLFRVMMAQAGVSKFRRRVMYWAVRLFGLLYWVD